MTLEELGRRAVACKHWRWMPGMLVDNIRIDGTCHHPGDLGMPWRQEDFREIILDAPCVPDLSDPATLGCLLALVREAWKANVSTTHWPEDGGKPAYWAIEIDRWYEGDTEGASLVAALEAAP